MSGLLDMLLQQPGPADRMMQLLPMLMQPASPSVPQGGTVTGDYSNDPWGVDPNGYQSVTRHGVTLDAEAMRSLQQARTATGISPFPYVGQGYRSPEQSHELYLQRHDAQGNLLPGMTPAADAGQSMHNYGLAFDAGGLPDVLRSYLLQHGWFNGVSNDPAHYSFGRNG